MNKAKSIFSLALAVVIIFALGAAAFAAGPYTITIHYDAAGHTYEAYQIFAGDLSEDGSKLSNIVWGSGVNGGALLAALQANESFTDVTSAADAADVLSGSANDSALAQNFASIVGKHLIAAAGRSAEGTGPYTIGGLEAGYYLVRDVNSPDAYTRFMLQVVSDVSTTPKTGVPTVEKKVQEINDSTGAVSGWQDAADYDLGDSIKFLLTGTLPGNYADYATYHYTFNDVLSAGLTYNGGAVVKVDGVVVTGGFEITHDNGRLTISCADLKQIAGVTAESVITVEYSATLNENAVSGAAGNPNTVNLVYSNNPNAGGAGDVAKTPEDKAVVFTFELDVNKVAMQGEEGGESLRPLEGAGFTLYKFDAATNDYVAVGAEITGVTTFKFKGMDAGAYKLVETTVPGGYNKIEDIIFKVVAAYETDSADPSLFALDIMNETGEASLTGVDGMFSVTSNYDLIVTNIENKSGAELPGTGGIGTTIFYIVGGLLVCVAAVLLIVRKRKSETED